MARARNIKPGFFKNYDLADLGPHCQILFAGLWCLADREGRLEDKPRLIKAEIFPYYEFDVNGGLTQLERCNFVRRYSVNGERFIEVLNFKKHQSPHSTEKASTYPHPQGEAEKTCLESIGTDIHESLTVGSRKSNGGNPPDSLIHGFTDSPNPDSLKPDSPNFCGEGSGDPLAPVEKPAKKKPKAKEEKTEDQQANSATWEAYALAYQNRYSAAPVRNAKANAMIASFVKSVGQADAPAIARYFINLNTQYYVLKMHDLSLLLVDAQAIRTQWLTKKAMTAGQARHADTLQTGDQAVQNVLDELDRRERVANGESSPMSTDDVISGECRHV